MHYNPKSIVNVLSLGVVAFILGVKYFMDTELERAIVVHLGNGDVIKLMSV